MLSLYYSQLPNHYKSDLTSYFLKFDTSHITHFVSDKYHYIHQVILAFEAIRKEVQKEFIDSRRKYFKRSKYLLLKHFKNLTDDQKRQVNVMLYTSENLANAYVLKENFYTFIASPDYETTKNTYNIGCIPFFQVA